MLKATAQRVVQQARLRRRNLVTQGFLGIERKYYDTFLAQTAVPANADWTATEFDPSATSMITTPVQGDGPQNRDGKRIVIDQVEVNGRLEWAANTNQTVLPDSFSVVVYLVLDTQSNGAQAQGETVFINPANDTQLNANSMRNLLSGARFRVLKKLEMEFEKKVASYDGTNIEVAGVGRCFRWIKKFKGGLPVNFNAGTTADIANVVDNSIHVYANASNTGITLGYNARIRFMG